MNIYHKPITEISYSDITQFLDQRYSESETLDYKSDWKDLSRSMAAFANTVGGIILLGVAEDGKTGQPALPPIGVDWGKGEDEIKQRVQNMAFDGVYPPLAPEVSVCRLDSDPSGAIVLIRISESHETPHWADNRQRVYVRVSSQNRFAERQAGPEEFDRLWNRRQAAIRLREGLIERARERAALIASWPQDGEGLDAPAAGVAQEPTPETEQIPTLVVEAYALPSFPDLPRIRLAEMLNFCRTQAGGSRIMPKLSFPIGHQVTRPIDRGVAVVNEIKRGVQYVQLDERGALHSQFQLTAYQQQSGDRVFFAHELLGYTDGFLDYLAKLCERFQELQAKPLLVSIRHTYSVGSYLYWVGSQFPEPKRILESEVQLLHEVIMPTQLRAGQHDLVRECARRLLWAAGLELAGDPDQMDRAMRILYKDR